MDIFEFIPIASFNKVLIFNSIDSKNVEMKSDWNTKTLSIKKEDLIDSIVLLKKTLKKKQK